MAMRIDELQGDGSQLEKIQAFSDIQLHGLSIYCLRSQLAYYVSFEQPVIYLKNSPPLVVNMQEPLTASRSILDRHLFSKLMHRRRGTTNHLQKLVTEPILSARKAEMCSAAASRAHYVTKALSSNVNLTRGLIYSEETPLYCLCTSLSRPFFDAFQHVHCTLCSSECTWTWSMSVFDFWSWIHLTTMGR